MLPSTSRDVLYDNAKFRRRSIFKVAAQGFATRSNFTRNCTACSTGKALILFFLLGLAYLAFIDSDPIRLHKNSGSNVAQDEHTSLRSLLRRPPRLPPRLPSDFGLNDSSIAAQVHNEADALWKNRQIRVAQAFRHAWHGYKSFAMGYDELRPLSKRGVDGLGGLGATVVDALDTALIMGLDDIVMEAHLWLEKELPSRLNEKGQVNLFETTIRVLGGLLSAFHLTGGDNETQIQVEVDTTLRSKSLNPQVYLDLAKDLGDRLMSAFLSSPTPIPYSDVILSQKTAHPAGSDGGASSTSEVATLQLEFLYLSKISGDPKYGDKAMRVFDHIKDLPKHDGLVPIYISPHTGNFHGNNIRLGSRGDSYYEYLLKVWLQQGCAFTNSSDYSYLRQMYDEAMEGVKNRLVRKSIPNGLVFVGELPYGPGQSFHPKMDHLVCFLAGNLALGATRGLTKQEAEVRGFLSESDRQNLQLAEDLGKTCYQMYAVTATGLAPEIAYFRIDDKDSEDLTGGKPDAEYKKDIIIKPLDRHNLLRPETVESLFVLYRVTRDPKYRQWGWEIFQAFELHAKVDSGGYSSLDDVTVVPAPKRDKMETFFLGETLKYLYLLFGDHTVLSLGSFVFNSEAHPIPVIQQKPSKLPTAKA